mgnify:CR=1 FL=1
MGVVYRCKKCGHILYKFERVGQDFYGVRTPSELKLMFANKCPKCGHELEIPKVEDIKIKYTGRY